MALLKRLWVLPMLAILAIAVVAIACGGEEEERDHEGASG